MVKTKNPLKNIIDFNILYKIQFTIIIYFKHKILLTNKNMILKLHILMIIYFI